MQGQLVERCVMKTTHPGVGFVHELLDHGWCGRQVPHPGSVRLLFRHHGLGCDGTDHVKNSVTRVNDTRYAVDLQTGRFIR